MSRDQDHQVLVHLFHQLRYHRSIDLYIHAFQGIIQLYFVDDIISSCSQTHSNDRKTNHSPDLIAINSLIFLGLNSNMMQVTVIKLKNTVIIAFICSNKYQFSVQGHQNDVKLPLVCHFYVIFLTG